MNKKYHLLLFIWLAFSLFAACHVPATKEKTQEKEKTATEKVPTTSPPKTTPTKETPTLKNTIPYKKDSIVEETKAYKIKAVYLIFEGEKVTPALKKQNEYITKLIIQKVAEFKEDATVEIMERTWIMDIAPTTVYADDRLFSVAFNNYQDCSGAHPAMMEFVYNYDLQKGEEITVANSFRGNYKAKLFPLMRKNVMEVYYNGEEGCDLAEYKIEATTFSFGMDQLIFYFPELPHLCSYPFAEIKYGEIPSDIVQPKSALASRY